LSKRRRFDKGSERYSPSGRQRCSAIESQGKTAKFSIGASFVNLKISKRKQVARMAARPGSWYTNHIRRR
jgi:hypothetical protein